VLLQGIVAICVFEHFENEINKKWNITHHSEGSTNSWDPDGNPLNAKNILLRAKKA